VLDIYGELFYRQGRMDEGRSILERATHALAPYPSLKAKLAVNNLCGSIFAPLQCAVGHRKDRVCFLD